MNFSARPTARSGDQGQASACLKGRETRNKVEDEMGFRNIIRRARTLGAAALVGLVAWGGSGPALAQGAKGKTVEYITFGLQFEYQVALVNGVKKRAATLESVTKAVKPCVSGIFRPSAKPGIFEFFHSIGNVTGVAPSTLKSYPLWVYFQM